MQFYGLVLLVYMCLAADDYNMSGVCSEARSGRDAIYCVCVSSHESIYLKCAVASGHLFDQSRR